MNKKSYDLIIFDCDGVLVDSEVITCRVFSNMLNELGFTISIDDVFERFVGKSMAQCLQMIAGLMTRDVPEDFVSRFHARTTAALKSELTAVPGIELALEAIRIPYCVASNGTHEKMQVTLGITRLLPKFKDRLFSVSEVARGKPFPDVFLHAARKLGAAPSSCAVIVRRHRGYPDGSECRRGSRHDRVRLQRTHAGPSLDGRGCVLHFSSHERSTAIARRRLK